MLAGCSSLLSPRHRLRSEASAQFQACHFQLPSMSTQRLDLPCTFSRRDASRSQPLRPVGIAVEKSIEAKTSGCSLKQNIRLPPSATSIEGRRDIKDEFWGKGKSLKRLAEQGSVDESCLNRGAKRKKETGNVEKSFEGSHGLSLGQHFWFQPGYEVLPRSVAGLTSLSPSQIPISLACGEEEKVFFMPPLPLSNNAWESVVTEITELGEKDVETSQGPAAKEVSGSSTSESHSLTHSLNENTSERETGNGSALPYLHEDTRVAPGNQDSQGEPQEFELISLLLACVEAISSKNMPAINHFIAKLGDLASPRGSSPLYRIAAYFTEALALRVVRVWPHIFHITTPLELDRVDDDDHGTALRLLNQVSPIPKFVHFTSNEILLRAFEGKDRVHIIDFDIKQGLQWPSLFQSLASRENPPSHVRITGIGESKQELNETGDRLAGFAAALNLPFEFHPVVDRLEDVRLWMLHVKEKECVAVNCIFQLHKMLYNGSGGALRDLLGLIRSTNPTIVLVAEQEAEHNDPSLELRVSNSLKYYSAIFDMVDSSLPIDSPVRVKIEEMFAREIRNIIACEGSDRFERHVSFEKWRNLLEQGGFHCRGISEREMLQSQMLLKMYSCENYRIVNKQGQDGVAALTLSWLDQPLYTVSAWSPADVAGSSSSFSQPT
ncbi:scarecrow-like protein 28 [Malania oleifera]|uniref:scarecrow-like protein 28 n=1 Tax=Malania oleifera TaxID=397392 RepID=UPI0025AE7940|nr:scarecrow-like protein 28 [Malania oleifera]